MVCAGHSKYECEWRLCVRVCVSVVCVCVCVVCVCVCACKCVCEQGVHQPGEEEVAIVHGRQPLP